MASPPANNDIIRARHDEQRRVEEDARKQSSKVDVKTAVYNMGEAQRTVRARYGASGDWDSVITCSLFQETLPQAERLVASRSKLTMENWIKVHAAAALAMRDKLGFFEVMTGKAERDEFDRLLVDQVILIYCVVGLVLSQLRNKPIDSYIEIDSYAMDNADKTDAERSWERLQDARLAREHSDFVQLQGTLLQGAETISGSGQLNHKTTTGLNIAVSASEFEVFLENARQGSDAPIYFLFSKFYDALILARETFKNDKKKLAAIYSGREKRVPALVSKIESRQKLKYRALARHLQLGGRIKRLMTDALFDGKKFYDESPFSARQDSLAALDLAVIAPVHTPAIGNSREPKNPARESELSENLLGQNDDDDEEDEVPKARPASGAAAKRPVEAERMDDSGGYIEEIVFSVPVMRCSYKYTRDDGCCAPPPPADEFRDRSRSTFGIKNFHKFVDSIIEARTAPKKVRLIDFTLARLSPRDSAALVRLIDACPNLEEVVLGGTAIDEGSFIPLCQALSKQKKLITANVSIFFAPMEFDVELLQKTKDKALVDRLSRLRSLSDSQYAMLIKALQPSADTLAEVVCAGGKCSFTSAKESDLFGVHHAKQSSVVDPFLMFLLTILFDLDIYPLPRGGGGEDFGRAVGALIMKCTKLVSVCVGFMSMPDEIVGYITRAVVQSKRVFTCNIHDNLHIVEHSEDSCCSCLGFAPTITKVIEPPSQKVLTELSEATDTHRIRSRSGLVARVVRDMFVKFDTKYKDMLSKHQQEKKDSEEKKLQSQSNRDRIEHERQLELRRAGANQQVIAFGNVQAGGANGGGAGAGNGSDNAGANVRRIMGAESGPSVEEVET